MYNFKFKASLLSNLRINISHLEFILFKEELVWNNEYFYESSCDKKRSTNTVIIKSKTQEIVIEIKIKRINSKKWEMHINAKISEHHIISKTIFTAALKTGHAMFMKTSEIGLELFYTSLCEQLMCNNVLQFNMQPIKFLRLNKILCELENMKVETKNGKAN